MYMDISFIVLGFYVLLSMLKVSTWAGDTVRCTANRVPYQKSYRYSYIYCRTSCCGSFPNQYCCKGCDQTDNLATIGIIVGSIIGSIMLVSFIVTVICCVVEKKTYSGVVFQPKQGVDMATNTEFSQPELNKIPSWYQPTPGHQLPGGAIYRTGYQQLPAVVFSKRQHMDPS